MKPPRAMSGFTLIELIGVMAIMAILASVLAPDVFRAMERAAVRAEAETLHALGEQTKLYLRDYGALPTTAVPPTSPNWTTQIATYASLSSADISANRRQMVRLYVPDPIAANHRAMFFSSMRTDVALPAAATIAANFQTIWDTASGAVPAAPGWSAWNADNVEFLIYERVNLSAVYRTDLQVLSVTLNNTHATAAASYQIILANGTAMPLINMPAHSTTAPALGLRPKDRLNLYGAAGGTLLDYSYVVSTTGKTFDFTSTGWQPQ